jgi:LysM repeat protein
LAAPTAFLLVVTLAVLLLHGSLRPGHSSTTPKVTTTPAAAAAQPKVYVVRAGDTLASIAGKTGVGTARLLTLNPKLQPTSLFLGERIRLR